MTRRPLLFGVLMLAASGFLACSAPVIGGRTQQPSKCSDRVAMALSSPNATVPGVIACLTDDMRASALSAGVASDSDFQKVAASDPAFTSYHLLGVTAAGGLVYELDGTTGCQVLEMTVDARGKVATINGLHTEQIKH